MTTISPLSNPKGVKLDCELCGRPAHIQCKSCRVAYYCDKSHEALDAKGIHERICQLLVPLRSDGPVLGTDQEREQREKLLRKRRTQLLDICKTEAHKKLYVEDFDLAIPAALQALRFSMDIYGKDSVELVPSYLLLGEASIGLKNFNQAEDYLSMAKWAVMKSSECDYEIRAQLCRNFGMLYASQKNFKEALEQLSEDVYYLSLLYGPEHYAVAGAYFQVGRVFEAMGNDMVAKVNFQKTLDIWSRELSMEESDERAGLGITCDAEGIQALSMISAFFEKSMGEYDNAHKIHRAGVEFLQSRLQLKSGNLEHALRAAQSAATRLDGVDAGTENDAYRQLVTDLAKQEIKIKHAVQQVATVRN